MFALRSLAFGSVAWPDGESDLLGEPEAKGSEGMLQPVASF